MTQNHGTTIKLWEWKDMLSFATDIFKQKGFRRQHDPLAIKRIHSN